jgi:hypothetical protein
VINDHVGGDAALRRGGAEDAPVTYLSEARTWPFLALILIIQLGLTLLDTTPRYLLDDSASYLWSVFHDGPFDRSWTYPTWFLRPVLTLHSLDLVVYVQCALAVIPAWLAFGLVSGPCQRCRIVALLTACACLIEPLALTYQRFILADGLGLVMAAAALFASVRLIDKNAGATVYAALTPLFLVLAASLRSSQIPSLALLCAFLLVLLFVVYRNYAAGVAFVGSLVLCNAVFFHYAVEHQHARGYNAMAGQFLLAAVLPIVSREDVQPYVDPAKTPAIVDDHARDRRARPQELFQPGFAVDQIHQASENLSVESRLGSRIAIHAIFRDPIGFLVLAWSTYLDYFDEPFVHGRVLDEAGKREFQPGDLSYFREQHIYDIANTGVVQSPVRSYFEGAWRYYSLIPAISALLLLASVAVDRRPSTLMLAAFALVGAASQIAFSTEPVPRYLIVSAWVNIAVAGRIACAVASRLLPSEMNRPDDQAISRSSEVQPSVP